MSISAVETRTIFNGYAVTATSNLVYTSEASTGSADGWYRSKADFLTLLVNVATLSATSLTYRIEGRGPSPYNRNASLAAGFVTSAHVLDEVVTINEHYDEIRIGVKVDNDDGTATPNNFYAGMILSEVVQ